MEKDIILEVNGKEVRLKDFPMRALRGVVLGFIKSLNLKESPREIKITLRVDEKDRGNP